MAVSVRKWGLLAAALVAGCLCAPAVALAEPPNDDPTDPVALLPDWTRLDVSTSSTVVQGGPANEDWPNATVNDIDDPPPECLGDQGYRSLWYAVDVPEPAVLKVSVSSTNVNIFQPVVSLYAPGTPEKPVGLEVGCGLAGPNRINPDAVASAYAYTGRYLVRVAQAESHLPTGGQPAVTIKVFARDVKPPKISIATPGRIVAPGKPAQYTATVEDKGAQVDWTTMRWHFCDPKCDQVGTRLSGDETDRTVEIQTYPWKRPGLHRVVFEIADKAGNASHYSWAVYVRDVTRPAVRFTTAVPIPGTRLLKIAIQHNEHVKVRLLVTQQRASGDPHELYRRILTMYKSGTSTRTILLRPRVGTGTLIITGIARDRAGNASLLPTCVIDPVIGTGQCFKPDARPKP